MIKLLEMTPMMPSNPITGEKKLSIAKQLRKRMLKTLVNEKVGIEHIAAEAKGSDRYSTWIVYRLENGKVFSHTYNKKGKYFSFTAHGKNDDIDELKK